MNRTSWWTGKENEQGVKDDPQFSEWSVQTDDGATCTSETDKAGDQLWRSDFGGSSGHPGTDIQGL